MGEKGRKSNCGLDVGKIFVAGLLHHEGVEGIEGLRLRGKKNRTNV